MLKFEKKSVAKRLMLGACLYSLDGLVVQLLNVGRTIKSYLKRHLVDAYFESVNVSAMLIEMLEFSSVLVQIRT